jgi:capsular polysaccharide biosynthesis protein
MEMPTELAVLLVKKMPLLFLVAMVGGGCAYLASFAVHPIYRASVLTAGVESDSSMSGAGGALAGLQSMASLVNINSRSEYIDKAIAVMRSRRFCETVMGLEANAAILEDEWRLRNKLLALLVGSGSNLSHERICSFFRDAVVQVSTDPKTRFATVSVRSIDRYRAAQWANDLVRQINAEMQSEAIDEAKQTLKYLEAEIAKTASIEVREAIGRAMESQIQKAAFAATRNSYVFSVLDPAAAPDEGKFESPHRSLLAAAGALVSLFIASVVLVIRRDLWRVSQQ